MLLVIFLGIGFTVKGEIRFNVDAKGRDEDERINKANGESSTTRRPQKGYRANQRSRLSQLHLMANIRGRSNQIRGSMRSTFATATKRGESIRLLALWSRECSYRKGRHIGSVEINKSVIGLTRLHRRCARLLRHFRS